MSHKLLLADDSVTIQRVIELTFADEDIQLTAVGDGRQAIERIEADPPDIVLADVGMPEKDGYEVAAYIKNDPRLAHIPVLLLTGAFEPVDEERARTAGCDGVLAKPFEPQMVISRVKELLAGAARRSSGPRRVPPSAIAAALPPPVRPDPAILDVSPQPAILDAPPQPAILDAPPQPAILDAPPQLAILDAPPQPRVTNAGPEMLTMSVGDMLAEWDARTLPVVAAPAEAEPALPNTPGQDSAAVTTPAFESTLRIRRRQTMVLPEPGVPIAAPSPALEPVRHAALDDYFERLDAAFTNLQSAPPSPPPPAPDDADWVPLAPEPPPLDLFALDRFPLDEPLATKPVIDPVFEREAPDPAPADEAVFERGRPAIAEAFSALLAAERGEADSGDVPSWFAQEPPPALDVDELVDRVTRQVLEQMSDRVVRDTVTDIVSRVAERLVREEIDRIKASIT